MNHVTLQQIINALIGLGGVVGALTALGSFVYVVLFRPFRTFLRREIVSSLTNIDQTLKRTENTLNAHIANPAAHHDHGDLYDKSKANSARSESRDT